MKKTNLVLLLLAVMLSSCAEKFKPIITILEPSSSSFVYDNLTNMAISVKVADVDNDLKQAQFKLIKNDDNSLLLDTTISAPSPVDSDYMFNFSWQVYNPAPTYTYCLFKVIATDKENQIVEETKSITLH